LAETSKEDYGSKRAVLPLMMMMMFRINFVEKIKHVLCAINFCHSHVVGDNEIQMSEDKMVAPLPVHFQACNMSTCIANDRIVLCSLVCMLRDVMSQD
jgi:hypothetical protein